MVRRLRRDEPGSWHHVMNRGLARRAMFEGEADVRYFLSRLARAVRSGDLEVHAWCVLATHFHLLVRSPLGRLSAALQQIQNRYVRYFNRDRRRDGSLVRGRFLSRPVDSLRYRRVLVRYIDANSVRAGLCRDARTYRWCSAHQYAQRRGPAWLCREWVDGMRSAAGEIAGERCREQDARLVAARWQARSGDDELDSLLIKPKPAVLSWLRARARLADGTLPGQPYLTTAGIDRAVGSAAARRGDYPLRFGTRTVSGWLILRVGLMRELAGARFVEIARAAAIPAMRAARLYQRHQGLVLADPAYGELAATLARDQLHHAFGE